MEKPGDDVRTLQTTVTSVAHVPRRVKQMFTQFIELLKISVLSVNVTIMIVWICKVFIAKHDRDKAEAGKDALRHALRHHPEEFSYRSLPWGGDDA